MLAKDVGVDPERDRWIGMPETFGYHMDRHASQQEVCGMNVPQIMESRCAVQREWARAGAGFGGFSFMLSRAMARRAVSEWRSTLGRQQYLQLKATWL